MTHETQGTSATSRELVIRDLPGAAIPYVRAGQAVDEYTPTILSAGVDTVYFSFDVEVSDAMWQRLADEQEIARVVAAERKADHCPDWLGARLAPTGAKGGYRFLIETPHFSIKLLKGVPHRPPIYVEMRAFGLHTHPFGELAVCEDACAFLRDTLLADQDETLCAGVNLDTARCSRLDLYLDWQGGWRPDFTQGDERHFVKRVHADVERNSVDGQVTGYHIGSGEVQARMYNKSVQAKKKHLDWYLELLAQRNGSLYDADQSVWRLEFQLLRAGVKGFKLRARPEMEDPDEVIEAELDAEDLPHIHSVRKAFHWAGRIWAYLTKRWLRLTIPTDDPNRGRWPEHPTWTALRDGFSVAMRGAPLPPNKLDLVRSQRYSGYQLLLDRMAVGVLDTLDAMDTDPGAALVSWLAYTRRVAGLVRDRQERRAAMWDAKEHGAQGLGRQTGYTPNLVRGMGARLDSLNHLKRREQLLDMALGVFTSAGVTHLQLPEHGALTSVSDLLLHSLDELEAIAEEKGGVCALLDEKWRRVYKTNAPRGIFTKEEMRVA